MKIFNLEISSRDDETVYRVIDDAGEVIAAHGSKAANYVAGIVRRDAAGGYSLTNMTAEYKLIGKTAKVKTDDSIVGVAIIGRPHVANMPNWIAPFYRDWKEKQSQDPVTPEATLERIIVCAICEKQNDGTTAYCKFCGGRLQFRDAPASPPHDDALIAAVNDEMKVRLKGGQSPARVFLATLDRLRGGDAREYPDEVVSRIGELLDDMLVDRFFAAGLSVLVREQATANGLEDADRPTLEKARRNAVLKIDELTREAIDNLHKRNAESQRAAVATFFRDNPKVNRIYLCGHFDICGTILTRDQIPAEFPGRPPLCPGCGSKFDVNQFVARLDADGKSLADVPDGPK